MKQVVLPVLYICFNSKYMSVNVCKSEKWTYFTSTLGNIGKRTLKCSSDDH